MENNKDVEYVVLKENGDIPYHLNAYLRSPRCSLYDTYKKPSEAKKAAWKHCEEMRAACGGQEPKICTYNTRKFTYAFITGVIPSRDEWKVPDWLLNRSLVLVYVTSKRQINYLVPISMMDRAVLAAKHFKQRINRP